MSASHSNNLSSLRLVFLAVVIFIVSGCAHYPINSDIEGIDTQQGYRIGTVRPQNSEDVLLVLAFSGGGTRAAALAYGVLEELAATQVTARGRTQRLLDEVDMISAVSGGSFTAAYFGLYGDRVFEDFESRFLKRNIQKELALRLFSPRYWLRLMSPLYDRSELAADYYDQKLFGGATYGDMLARQGPIVLIHATDLTLGTQFTFSQQQFDWICSDLNRFPVSRAVAASSAVPVLLSQITLRNYAGRCGYQLPSWAVDTLRTAKKSSRDYYRAARIQRYLDADERPFIHLLDGGLADNLGLHGAIDGVALLNQGEDIHYAKMMAPVRKLVIIVANAETKPDIAIDKVEVEPTLSQLIKSATDVQINRYNFETVAMLRNALADWEEQQKAQCGTGKANTLASNTAPSTEDCAGISTYYIEVNFEAISDKKTSRLFKGLPTSFNLPADTIDQLREASRSILKNSPEFQRLLIDLQ